MGGWMDGLNRAKNPSIYSNPSSQQLIRTAFFSSFHSTHPPTHPPTLFPIQGGAADVVMMAMLRIEFSEVLKRLGWKLLLQIHDEVIVEGPDESKEEALAEVRPSPHPPTHPAYIHSIIPPTHPPTYTPGQAVHGAPRGQLRPR